MKETDRRIYIGAEIEIICLKSLDVITTSGGESYPGPDSSDTDYEGGVDW